MCVGDGQGDEDLLNLVVEIKGCRGADAKEKKSTMGNSWVPGVNRQGSHGRWAFAGFIDVHAMPCSMNLRPRSSRPLIG